MSFRVLVATTVEPEEEADFESAYRAVAARMIGTPGHVRDELLRQRGAEGRYVLFAEWTDDASFFAWVSNPAHTDKTKELVPYLERFFERSSYDFVAESGPGA